MTTVAEHVPFLHLCKLCQKISEKKGKEKRKPLKDFIDGWRDFHNKLHANNSDTTDSFYSAMRLIIPQFERQRAAYGIKEFTLAKLLIDIFCLNKNGVDAQKLLNYRSPRNMNTGAGDFASVAYFVLKNRSSSNGSLKVHDVNFYLDNIAENNASGNKDEVKTSLLYLLRNTSALEQKWLIRMILKDMKLGMSENSVLKTYHDDAIDLFDVTNNLEKVCISLKDPNVHLHEIEISLFSPFRPMLAEMALPNQAEKLIRNRPFAIETKYDGERLQLHKDGSSYMYFSRRGHDCTEPYGDSPAHGSLTPDIHRAFATDVKSCVLDGEVVIYSTQMNCIVSKGENADVQYLQPGGDYGPCFCVFDILMLNGKVLSNLPLKERVPHLKNTFRQIDNKIRYTEQKLASTNEEVLEELNLAIDNRLEGIIVKDLESIYKPNQRKNSGWIKVKPEYIDNLMDELDVLIVGGYFGERRSTLVSHFLLAVASPEKKNEEPAYFYAFCKIGSGYSFKELYELSAKLQQHWQTFSEKKPPSNILFGGRKPDLWIEPSKSQIVQVKASEIVRSKTFALDYTLRFPRVEKIRYDKAWYDCMTTTQFEDLRKLAQGRLATRNVELENEEEPSPKKQRIHKERVLSVAPHFRPTDVTDVHQVSELLKDKELCVVLSSLSKKQKAEKQIVEHGGKFVQNPGNKTYCVVTDKVTAKVKNIIKTGLYDVVKIEWLDRCFEMKSFISWVPEDMLHVTDRTRGQLAEYYDKYGDHYIEECSVESLKKIFNSIPNEEWKALKITNKHIADLEDKYFSGENAFSLFRICCVYINKENEDLLSSMELTEQKLELYGADVVPNMDLPVTHVIVSSSDSSSVNRLKKISAKRKRNRFHIVTDEWVDDCIEEGRLLGEREYMPL